MEVLTRSLQHNRTVETLDLSFNYMGDECCSYVTKLISNQSERKDNVVWLHGLRGDAPHADDITGGLQPLVLRCNGFGDYVATELARVLTFDTYIRSVDMRHNQLGDKGVQQLLGVLKTNRSLLNLDT